MFNLVVLTGRMVADPELKYTQSNIPVCSFTIAVDRRGKEEKQTDFINIVAWRQSAEFVTKYFHKGDMIGIEGSIQTRKYQDKDGNNRVAFEIVANNIQFVESKKTEGNSTVMVENAPQSNFEPVSAEQSDISGDDLPF